MQLKYTVVAGKYDGFERNTKYINDFGTLEEAFDDVAGKQLNTYPWCEIEVDGVVDGQSFIIDCKYPRNY